MRRSCKPCLVDESGEPSPLTHIEFADAAIAETFLQEALDRTPQTMPVDELDSSFGPLISLGREIDHIDNLFISPAGRLTIVETKLWRNPEATRQVVAQILDYATRVSTWSYTDLESQARRSALPPAPIGSGSLYDFVASKAPDEVLPEPEFVDAVEATLRAGRFMLLVVGDGIRESIEAMVTALQEHPQKFFTFGLVQLQVYTSPRLPGSHLIIPQVVANTTEILRYVVHVETTGQATVSVEIDNREPEKATAGARHTLTEDEFLAKVQDPESKALFKCLLEFGADLGAVPSWGTSSVSIRLPDPAGARTRYTLYVLTALGGVYTGWMLQQLDGAGRSSEIAADYVEGICRIFPGVSPRVGAPDCLSRTLSAAEVSQNLDEFEQAVRNVVERLGTTDPR